MGWGAAGRDVGIARLGVEAALEIPVPKRTPGQDSGVHQEVYHPASGAWSPRTRV